VRLARGDSPAVLIIDGRSGSGKSTLATRLAAASGAQIVRLDDLYPGWDGLLAGSERVTDALVSGRYRAWDWGLEIEGETCDLDLARPVIVEGCGSLTARNCAAAHEYADRLRRGASGETSEPGHRASIVREVWTLWLECPGSVRRSRALSRETDGGGEAFAPHWEAWARQEDQHVRTNHPVALAREIRHEVDPATPDLPGPHPG